MSHQELVREVRILKDSCVSTSWTLRIVVRLPSDSTVKVSRSASKSVSQSGLSWSSCVFASVEQSEIHVQVIELVPVNLSSSAKAYYETVPA